MKGGWESKKRGQNKQKKIYSRTNQMPKFYCPIADQLHLIWKRPKIKTMNNNDQQVAKIKQSLYFGGLEKEQRVRFNLTYRNSQPIATLRNQTDEGNHAFNVSVTTKNQRNEVASVRWIVVVQKQPLEA